MIIGRLTSTLWYLSLAFVSTSRMVGSLSEGKLMSTSHNGDRCNITGKCEGCCRCCQCEDLTFHQIYGIGYYDVESDCVCTCSHDCAGLTCSCTYAESYRSPSHDADCETVVCGCSRCKSFRLTMYGIGPNTPLSRVPYDEERYVAEQGYL